MMQVTNRFDNINYFQNGSKQAENMVTPPQLPTKREKIGFLKGTGAYLVGGLTYNAIDKISKKTLHKSILKNLTNNKPGADVHIDKVLADTFAKTNLASKGTELVDIAKLSDITITMPDGKTVIKTVKDQVGNFIVNEYKKVPIYKQIFENNNNELKNSLKLVCDRITNMLTKGNNAAYLMRTNKILINSEKIGYAGFHEMGHAINQNFSTIGKSLQKMRLPMLLTASIFPVFALLTNKRTENNPPQTKWQKTKNFIKENVGKLTTLAFIPIIAEEIMASVRGQKLAKNILPKELMKNVSRTHMLSTTSYITKALIAGVGAFAANKVRDLVAHGKQSA